MSDAWTREAARAKQALQDALSPHLKALYNSAYRMTESRHDAEDLVQKLLVKVCEKSTEFEKIEYPRSWMMQIMYRLFIDQVRRQKRSPIKLMVDNIPGNESKEGSFSRFASTQPGPDQEVHLANRREQIKNAFRRLSNDHRLVLSLHDVDGYTLKELNIILDTPIGTLKSRLHRARAQMRSLLELEPSTDLIR